jgi:hypothetical protein
VVFSGYGQKEGRIHLGVDGTAHVTLASEGEGSEQGGKVSPDALSRESS